MTAGMLNIIFHKLSPPYTTYTSMESVSEGFKQVCIFALSSIRIGTNF